MTVWATAALFCAAAHAAEEIPIVVWTVDEGRIEGELLEFNLDRGLVIRSEAADHPLSISARDLVRIERAEQPDPRGAAHCMQLRGGDVLYGTLVGAAPDQLVARTPLGESTVIRLDQLQAFLTPQAHGPQWRAALQRLLELEPDEDRVLMSNGDVMTGFVASIEPQRILFERRQQEIEIGMGRVVAVAMADEGADRRPGRPARLWFIDGSTLAVASVQWSPEDLGLSALDTTLRDLPPEIIQRVELDSPRWRWLSDVQPSGYHHTPLLSLRWDYRVDRSVTGSPLRIGGRRFEHGIGVHSLAVLTYDLKGEYRRFSGWCGLDDSAGSLAAVSASVVVDRQVKWQQVFTRTTPPRHLRIDLDGAHTLELRVDFGDHLDVQDRFDWADAALVR